MKRTATQRQDRRVERTRKALLEALLQLIVEKGYDRTTVQDVLERADVGRATFYAHFYNKKDLLLGRMSVFQLDVDEPGTNNGGTVRMPDVTRLFEHVAGQRALYLAMRGTAALEDTLAVARADLTRSFQKLLGGGGGANGNGASLEVQFRVQFLTGALLQLLIWWLDAGMPETAKTMNRWFGELGERITNQL